MPDTPNPYAFDVERGQRTAVNRPEPPKPLPLASIPTTPPPVASIPANLVLVVIKGASHE